MKLLLALTAAVAFALSAFGQPQLSIKGIAREGTGGPALAGVSIVLKEFRVVDGVVTGVPYITAYTDARGEYEFKPERMGDFILEAAKQGYWSISAQPGISRSEAAEASVSLSAEQPQASIDFYLTQPGYLEGTVIDENGDALANQTVSIEPPDGSGTGYAVRVTTDAEGRFRSDKLQAGDYVVRLGPARDIPTPLDNFTEEDTHKIDRDFEPSYWPGGVTDPATALPIRVPSGGIVNAGVIRPRTIDRYRVRLQLKGADCGVPLHLSIGPNRPALTTRQVLDSGMNVPSMPIPCAEEILAIGLAPGPYRLALINRDYEGPLRWAAAEVVIGPDTEPIEMELVPPMEIPVKVFAYEGGLPPDFTGRIGGQKIENQRAVLRSVAGFEWPIHVQLDPPYYVHSMRYGGQPVTDYTVRVTSGAELEVIVDNRAAQDRSQ